VFSTMEQMTGRFSRSLLWHSEWAQNGDPPSTRSQRRKGTPTQRIRMAADCMKGRKMARMLPTRTEARALQRCNLSAVPGAKTEGGRSLTAHLPSTLIKSPSDLAPGEKTFVAGCHDCDSTGCPHAQQISVMKAAKPRTRTSGLRAKPALRNCEEGFNMECQL
jgi:hypothetical protein